MPAFMDNKTRLTYLAHRCACSASVFRRALRAGKWVGMVGRVKKDKPDPLSCNEASWLEK